MVSVLSSATGMDSMFAKLADTIFKRPVRGDDFVDRLHYFVTVAILVIFAIGTGVQEHVGQPINCWSPKDFHYDSYHGHINSYCWTHKLRYPKYERETVLSNATKGTFDLSQPKPLIDFGTAFFRWVTLVFVVQACLFKIPNFLWNRLNMSSGADLQKIRDLVLQAQTAETEESKSLQMDEVVAYFENWITGYRSYRLKLAGKHSAKLLTVLFCLGKKSGSYLSSLYLFIKVCNILNVLGNFALLTVFLDLNFWKYGLVVLNSVINYGDWQDPYNFPRLLLCDFVVEGGSSGQTTVQEYQLQCTMTLNLLLEKIFVLEWFWLIFLFIMSVVNLFTWAVKIKPPCSTILFSKSYIKTVESYPSIEVGLASLVTSTTPANVPGNKQKEFVENYLRSDGVFVLKLLELNADRAVVADVIRHLWDRYRITKNCRVVHRYNGETTPDGNEMELAAVKDDSL